MDGPIDPKDLAKLSFIDYTQEERGSEGSWRVVATERFLRWFKSLKDTRGRRLIEERIRRLASGQLGDSRAWGGGIWELRIHFGPGLRVYFAYEEGRLILLLGGGSKRNQGADVARARTTLMLLSPKRT